jgi:hypothetical protein
MAQEPTKQQVGEGSDNYGNAAKQMAKAAKTAGKTAKAATDSVRATANAAASTVNAGVKAGKAVAGIAKGVAVGGPWGAIISAAWSLRHTLFKILVCVCMFVLILIITIVSLPSIVFGGISGKNSFLDSYDDLSVSINNTINDAYDSTLERIVDSLTGSAFDLVLSLANIVDNTRKEQVYDVCSILASYSVSMNQQNTSKSNLLEKMNSVSDRMFPVSYEERTLQRKVVNSLGEVLFETVNYLVCTISPFDDSVILDAFNLDLDAKYSYGISNREYVDYLTESIRKTLAEEK